MEPVGDHFFTFLFAALLNTWSLEGIKRVWMQVFNTWRKKLICTDKYGWRQVRKVCFYLCIEL